MISRDVSDRFACVFQLDYIDNQYLISVPLAFDTASLAGRRMESLTDIR